MTKEERKIQWFEVKNKNLVRKFDQFEDAYNYFKA